MLQRVEGLRCRPVSHTLEAGTRKPSIGGFEGLQAALLGRLQSLSLLAHRHFPLLLSSRYSVPLPFASPATSTKAAKTANSMGPWTQAPDPRRRWWAVVGTGACAWADGR